MSPDHIMEQTFIPLVKQQGLNGALSNDEILALFGVCQREISTELAIAAQFLSRSPSRESVMEFYKTEKTKDAHEIMSAVDTSPPSIDIGPVRGVRFTPPMWEAVRGCRVAGHFGKLDELANFYASRWGSPDRG